MPRHRRFELDELANRPGTYFNPHTEVLVLVDDSPEIDQEIFDMDEFAGEEWVLVSDSVPVDESARDELLERFQALESAGALDADDEEDEDEDEDEDDLDDGLGDDMEEEEE